MTSDDLEAFDVVIVGAGLVGAALALALGTARARVALVDPALAAPMLGRAGDDWDARIYALSPASVRFLEAIGAWQHVDVRRVRDCERMRVFGDAGASELAFSAYETGVPALATLTESSEVAAALDAELRRAAHVTLFAERPAAFERESGRSVLVLASGRILTGSLLVGADGARSWVREAAGFSVSERPYGQTGVVANFAIARAHGGSAFQWFRGDSVLAYLPLPGDRMSMVWSCRDEQAELLLALAPEQLAARVAAAGEDRLGALELITPARGFPLTRMSVTPLAAERVALVGDAAHVVHPLAGQGVNLGFGDARSLAGLVATRAQFRDCGDARLLRAFERERREAILAMLSLTDGLERLFAAPGELPRWLRNTGLTLTGRVPGLKTLLARHALG